MEESYTHLPSITNGDLKAEEDQGLQQLRKGKPAYSSARKGLGPANKYGQLPAQPEFERRLKTIDLQNATHDVGLMQYLNSSMDDYSKGMQ